MASHTSRVAEFAANLKLSDVPTEVVARVKSLVLDGIGCGLFAAHLEWTEKLAGVIRRLEPQGGPSVIWGRGETASATSAALINGTMIQGYELDDANAACFHACAVVLPAVFGAADYNGVRDVDGERLLTAIVAGFEIGPRVGLCMNGDRMLVRGWHAPGIFAPFASAVAAGVVLRLDTAQMIDALGSAGAQAAGLMASQFGSMVKRMLCGKNAQAGLYSALLAADGFTGIKDVFEQEYGGFCTTFSQTKDEFDLSQLSAGLGERWETLNIAPKRFCVVGTNMAALDAVEELVVENRLKAGDIEAVTVSATHSTISHGGWWPYEPTGLTGAQMHMGFCIAMLLIEGDVFVDGMIPANIARPDLIELANRVRVVHSEERERMPKEYGRGADVELALKNGTVLRRRADFFRGSPQRPLTEAHMQKKYRQLASKTLHADAVAAIERSVQDLDRAASIVPLVKLLQGEARP